MPTPVPLPLHAAVRALRRLLLPAVCAAAVGCASLEEDRYLAPVYSEYSTAGGGHEVEALGGAILARRDEVNGPVRLWGLRPLFLHRNNADGSQRTDFLAPFGSSYSDENERTWKLLPIVRYSRERDEHGAERWSYLSLPGFYFAGLPDGRLVRAWFPIAGHVEGLMTFGKLDFVLWPLYVRSEYEDYVNWHILWPFFGWTTGEGASGWRVWPLYGHKEIVNQQRRTFVLWPIFQYSRNRLYLGPEGEVVAWCVFPLYSRTRSGSMRSWTMLWPFFGYASNPETGFWAWDGPWPLVRLQRSGRAGGVERTRFWPLWSNYRGDGLDSSWYLWPFFNLRHEEYFDGSRDADVLIPFWQSYDRRWDDGRRSRYQKLWPLFQAETGTEREHFSFLALSPLWRLPRVDEQWEWIWQLYARDAQETGAEGAELVRERGWLGLYRREQDADEDRQYVPGVWARREYELEGARVVETSWLFGLLRYRMRADDSLEFLAPALPGPGWPLERVPSSTGAGAAPAR